MSIYQLNIEGKNKVETAIERIKFFCPPEGYYIAYSGGKDSTVIKALTRMAGVEYDAHYNTTTVDPPELVQFIKQQKDIKREFPELTMWELIPKKLIPPTRLARYCCSYLKEGGGAGRFVMTGVRWAESSKRKKNRSMIEFDRYGSQSKEAIKRRQEFVMSDNNTKRRMLETETSRGGCRVTGKHILNPIVDWTDQEVWEFIKDFKTPYCELYDKGFKRLGCIGCPMSTHKHIELDMYPKYKEAYLRAFQRMLDNRLKKGLKTQWRTPEEVMEWWVSS